MSRVMVAMSGGVDSSVAALLLSREGFDVVGATMQIWPGASEDILEEHGGCCSYSAVHDAKRVCDTLGIPHYVINLRREFEQSVIEDFCSEYQKGRTPNPCIVCNRVVKFEHLLHRALELQASYLATGHYARVTQNQDGRFLLKKSLQPEKDQSYALYSLTQRQLSHTLFPVGDLSKAQVRQIAASSGLPTFEKPESQDICFVVSGRYSDFLRDRCPSALVPGRIVDSGGRVIGRHTGIANFTVGQRRGLGIAAAEPLYVLEIREDTHEVVVGTWDESLSHGLVASECNWISVPGIREPLEASVKIRYRSEPVRCIISPIGGHSHVRVTFESPQRAVTPGQAAVFYHDDVVVGGGTIERAIRSTR